MNLIDLLVPVCNCRRIGCWIAKRVLHSKIQILIYWLVLLLSSTNFLLPLWSTKCPCRLANFFICLLLWSMKCLCRPSTIIKYEMFVICPTLPLSSAQGGMITGHIAETRGPYLRATPARLQLQCQSRSPKMKPLFMLRHCTRKGLRLLPFATRSAPRCYCVWCD